MRAFLAVGLMFICAAVHAADWEYSDSTDPMTSKSSSKAVAISENSLNLDFPYAGDNYGILVVRNHPRYGTGVVIQIQKGQFLCSEYSGCPINVRFDDRPQIRFNGSPSADHDSTLIFFNNEKKFISEAKKAKKILVQANIYQGGAPILEFSVSKPLEWPTGGKEKGK